MKLKPQSVATPAGVLTRRDELPATEPAATQSGVPVESVSVTDADGAAEKATV